MHKNILIIADIEGSSGCASYAASSFNTPEWYNACVEMSLDISAVVSALYDAGAENIYVKDFHRTGYNLLPELIDSRARIIHGYIEGPVPGIGNIYDSDAAMFIGMHASSGSDGFLAHTFTSRYSRMISGGRRVTELQLFASSLYTYNIKPVFFSGCPVACREAAEDVPGINTFPVIKDSSGRADIGRCRGELAAAAAHSLLNNSTIPYMMPPPYSIELTMRDGAETAGKSAKRWGVEYMENEIFLHAENFDDLYRKLIGITYLTPALEKITAAALMLFNLYGRAGLSIARRKMRKRITSLLQQPRSSRLPG